jgi:hypothetical protein
MLLDGTPAPLQPDLGGANPLVPVTITPDDLSVDLSIFGDPDAATAVVEDDRADASVSAPMDDDRGDVGVGQDEDAEDAKDGESETRYEFVCRFALPEGMDPNKMTAIQRDETVRMGEILEAVDDQCDGDNKVTGPQAAVAFNWLRNGWALQKENDRAEAKETQQELARGHGGVDNAAQLLAEVVGFLDEQHPSVGKSLREARLPDGTRLSNKIWFFELLHAGVRALSEDHNTSPRVIAQAERYADLLGKLKSDVGAFQNDRDPVSGKTGSDEMLEIDYERDGRAAATARSAPPPEIEDDEEAELEKLMNNDWDTYRNGKWRKTGMSPQDRAMQIARVSAGE